MVFIRTFRHMPGENLEIGFRFKNCEFYERADKINTDILEASLESPISFWYFLGQ
jgi:hypothetical protein